MLVLWGAEGRVGTHSPPLEIWREFGRYVRGEAIPECGHFVPEEQPAIVADKLLQFLE